MFMHDNARPHTARCVNSYLSDVRITRLDWPARSPVLNQIENDWDMLKRRIRSSPNPPETLNQLKTTIVAAREEISQVDIKNVFQCMSYRMQAFIRA